MKDRKRVEKSTENQNWKDPSVKEDLMSSVLYREYLELTQKKRNYRMDFLDLN